MVRLFASPTETPQRAYRRKRDFVYLAAKSIDVISRCRYDVTQHLRKRVRVQFKIHLLFHGGCLSVINNRTRGMQNVNDEFTPEQIIERLSELYGTDTYSIEGDSPEVWHLTAQILNSIYPVCGNSNGALIQWAVTEHNRSYGNLRRFSMALVVSVPKQRKESRRLSKSKGEVDGDQNYTQLPIPGEGAQADGRDSEQVLTTDGKKTNVVPRSDADNEVEVVPQKRRKA